MGNDLTDFINQLTGIISAIIPILVSLALLFFVWGLAQWLLNMADSEKHKEGKQRMMWGIIALFFIVSVSGLIMVLQATFFGMSAGSLSPNKDSQPTKSFGF
ncbi:MAG: pilin [Patescibacteria group bacterium UBA2163]